MAIKHWTFLRKSIQSKTSKKVVKMKTLRSESGNALVVTILVLVLSTVIGLTLMSMTINGLKRNETREDMNQATQQAEKGITYISKLIEQEVEQVMPKPVVGPGIKNSVQHRL